MRFAINDYSVSAQDKGWGHGWPADRFPDADEVRVGIPSEIVESIGFSSDTAVVLVSHEYKYDLPILKSALASAAACAARTGSAG